MVNLRPHARSLKIVSFYNELVNFVLAPLIPRPPVWLPVTCSARSHVRKPFFHLKSNTDSRVLTWGGISTMLHTEFLCVEGGDGVCYCDVQAAWRGQRGVFLPSHVRCFSDAALHFSFFLSSSMKREACLNFLPGKTTNLMTTQGVTARDARCSTPCEIWRCSPGGGRVRPTLLPTHLLHRRIYLTSFTAPVPSAENTSDTFNTCWLWNQCNLWNAPHDVTRRDGGVVSSTWTRLNCFNSLCAETKCHGITFVVLLKQMEVGLCVFPLHFSGQFRNFALEK